MIGILTQKRVVTTDGNRYLTIPRPGAMLRAWMQANPNHTQEERGAAQARFHKDFLAQCKANADVLSARVNVSNPEAEEDSALNRLRAWAQFMNDAVDTNFLAPTALRFDRRVNGTTGDEFYVATLAQRLDNLPF